MHLVTGDDEILRARAVDKLIVEMLGNDDRSLALEDFSLPADRAPSAGDLGAGSGGGPPEGESVSASERRTQMISSAAYAAATPPFGTVRRVVVIRNLGTLSATDAEPLTAYLANPLDTTALILVSGGGRLTAGLLKAAKAAGAAEVQAEDGKVPEVLRQIAKEAGVKFSTEALAAIAGHLGEDVGRVPELVELLRSAYGDKNTLGLAEVLPYLGSQGTIPIYELANAIDSGDHSRAIEILHRLLTATSSRSAKAVHPVAILTILHNHYSKLLRLDDPEIRTSADAVAALGGKVKEYPAKKSWSQARVLGTDGLRSSYQLLAQADLDLKGASGLAPEAVVEVLVARLAGIARRRGA